MDIFLIVENRQTARATHTQHGYVYRDEVGDFDRPCVLRAPRRVSCGAPGRVSCRAGRPAGRMKGMLFFRGWAVHGAHKASVRRVPQVSYGTAPGFHRAPGVDSEDSISTAKFPSSLEVLKKKSQNTHSKKPSFLLSLLVDPREIVLTRLGGTGAHLKARLRQNWV